MKYSSRESICNKKFLTESLSNFLLKLMYPRFIYLVKRLNDVQITRIGKFFIALKRTNAPLNAIVISWHLSFFSFETEFKNRMLYRKN